MDPKDKLDRGEFLVLAEITPPKGIDVAGMLDKATQLEGHVDALLVPDMTAAVLRMSALGVAALLQRQGLETLMEVCCRDRNRLALQADLLAAGALGVRNLLVSSAEEARLGDHHQAQEVNDLQVTELLETIRGLGQGRDMAGGELAGAPRFLTGASVRAGLPGKELAAAVEEMKAQAERGAAYFVTSPVFDLAHVRALMEAARGLKVVPTVLLLKSLGMARYIAAHSGKIHLPAAVIERIQDAEEASRECVRIAAEMVAALRREGAAGVVLSTVGWEARVPEILGSEIPVGPQPAES